MNRKTTATALTATALAFALTACGGGSTSGKTSGLFDEGKRIKATKAVAAKTKQVREPKFKETCTRYKNGVCKSKMRTPDGFKTVTKTITPGKPAKSALYCIELDNVGGKPNRDDRWFAVSSTTYHKLVRLNEGAKVTNMKYERKLDRCSR